jgi:transposase
MTNNMGRKCLIAKLMEPIIACLRSFGGSAKPKVVVGCIYKDILKFDTQQEGKLEYGHEYICDQIRWARQYLVWEGMIDNSKRGIWSLSPEGTNEHLSETDGENIIHRWDKIHAQTKIINEGEITSKNKAIALFRYGIISDFVNQEKIEYGMKADLFRLKCNCCWKIPYSKKTRITRSTILQWISKYNKSGNNIEALYPQERNDINVSRAIDDKTINNIIRLTKESNINNARSLLTELNLQHLVTQGIDLKYTSVVRLLHKNGIWDTLNSRKTRIQNSIDIADANKLWLQSVMQGKIDLDELKKDMPSQIPRKDIEILYECIKSRPTRYRNRAISVLAISKGVPRALIAKNTFISPSAVSYNYNKYKKNGLTNITCDKRNVFSKYNNQNYIDKLFSILHSPPSAYDFNRTSWKQGDILKVMASENLAITIHDLGIIIKNSGYTYRKARKVLTSHDPNYKEKVQNINSILSNLKDDEKFFSIDEYGPFAVKMQGGKSLVPPGTIKTVPQWQKSKGSIIVTAALELSTNQITHFYSKDKNTTEMIKLLNILVEKYANQRNIYFSWDTASWHASKKLNNRVDEINSAEYKSIHTSPYVRLAPLPTCAQFLNVIESIFSGMARAIIHNSNYDSTDACMAAIDRYIFERNTFFINNPRKAGDKIWGKERTVSDFKESNNCKDPLYSNIR